jgi:hypothetical protein
MNLAKHALHLFAIILLNVGMAEAQLGNRSINDPLFSSKGKSMITMATGIPYAGIAEYAYGFSDRFSLGIIAGHTTKVPGYGIRVRYIFHKRESFKIFFRVPIFYYPQTKGLGGEPWFLTWPVVSAEWKMKSGIRFSAGSGFVAAACADALLTSAGVGKHLHDQVDELIQGDEHPHHDEGFMGGFWNTYHIGLSVPLSKRVTFQSEVSVVRSGVKKVGADWVGRIPVILVLGFSYVL